MSRICTHIYTHVLSCKSDTIRLKVLFGSSFIIVMCTHESVAAVWRGFGKNMKSVLPTISMGLWMGMGGGRERV